MGTQRYPVGVTFFPCDLDQCTIWMFYGVCTAGFFFPLFFSSGSQPLVNFNSNLENSYAEVMLHHDSLLLGDHKLV